MGHGFGLRLIRLSSQPRETARSSLRQAAIWGALTRVIMRTTSRQPNELVGFGAGRLHPWARPPD
jgi:hypothetical protein